MAPHTSLHLGPKTKLMTVVSSQLGPAMYCQHACETGDMVIVRGPNVIQVGQVLRIVREDPDNETAVLAPWWVQSNEKYAGKVNLFGKWSPDARPDKKMAKRAPFMTIPLADVLVWPVTMEETDGGQRIPLTAFHYLRSRHGIDLSHHEYSFSKRGAKFYNEVVEVVATNVREAQM